MCTLYSDNLCHMSTCLNHVNRSDPESCAGNSDNLDRFFIQFEIACQINSWPDNQKTYWLCQCLEGPALSFINGLLEKVCQ